MYPPASPCGLAWQAGLRPNLILEFYLLDNEQLSTDSTKPLRLVRLILYAAKLMPNNLIVYL